MYEELRARGVEFRGALQQEPFGRIGEFSDPDGHTLYIWQPPPKGSGEYEEVRPIVEHYQKLAARLRA